MTVPYEDLSTGKTINNRSKYISLIIGGLVFILLYLFVYSEDIGLQSFRLQEIIFVPTQRKPLFFRKRPETSHIDCGRALRNDKLYMASVRKRSRIKLKPTSPDMSCQAVLQRVPPPVKMKATNYGIAFARIVYTNYEFLEAELRSQYHPENHFCFSVDKKASPDFHSKMKALADCLPNVYLTPDEFRFDSYGHFQNHAHYQCMTVLEKIAKWEYIILLQNHDIMIKSVYELPLIYRQLGGANDVEITPCPPSRCDTTIDWNARTLNLFRNDSLINATQRNASIQWAKGAVQASLSRKAVEWMINSADLTILIERINDGVFGVDEILTESLQVSDGFDMPGRFTSECLKRNQNTPFITRMSHWAYISERECASRTVRHAICILGLEDVHSLSRYPHVMANKFLPDFDYAGVDCIHELLFNRTFLNQEDQPLHLDYYRDMPNVKYHRSRLANITNPVVDCRAPQITPIIQYP